MLSKFWSRMIFFAGIGALINSIIFASSFSEYVGEPRFVIFFYFIHSLITIVAGYLCLRREKIGVFFLKLSFILFMLSLMIPINWETVSGVENISLFLFTIIVSALTSIMNPYFFSVIIFTILFVLSVFISFILIILKFFKKVDIVEADKEKKKYEKIV